MISVPIWVPLLLVAAAAFLYLAWRAIGSAVNLVRKALESSHEFAIAATSLRMQIDRSTEEIKAGMVPIPKMLEAVAKIGAAQLEIMQVQRDGAKNPFGRPNTATTRDVENANLEYQVSEMMRAHGLTREEALLRLNPANQGSVWEGDQIFQGWR